VLLNAHILKKGRKKKKQQEGRLKKEGRRDGKEKE